MCRIDSKDTAASIQMYNITFVIISFIYEIFFIVEFNTDFTFAGKPIDYTGDPLEDLTLIRFLDRYVFKNPKKLDDKKVLRKNDLMAQRAGYVPKGIRSLPVDSAAYLNETEERIPVDELFLYRFLKQKNEIKKRIKREDDDNEDLESVNSEEFNDMLDNLKGGQDFDDLDIAADIVPRKKKGKLSYSCVRNKIITNLADLFARRKKG